MCTVTYIPLKSNTGNIHFLLTSNRDEKIARPAALLPAIFQINNKRVAMPLDPVGNGSWIAIEEKGKTICLLNGAFEPHSPTPPYRHSRGLVIAKYFSFQNATDFAQAFDFDQLEPFTLVVAENNQLYEFKWDGVKLHHFQLNPTKPYIWSSATLYSPDVRLKRESLFKDWLVENSEKLVYQPELILNFHQFKNETQDIEGIEINRNNFLRTVSITTIKKNDDLCTMKYKDLVHDQSETIKFSIYTFEESI